jgi:hypothetical protein
VEEDPFDQLLDAMPKIAEAVNSFSSPEVQRRAFEALLATLAATVNEGGDHPPGHAPAQSKNGASSAPSSEVEPNGRSGTDAAGTSASTPEAGQGTSRAGSNGRTRRTPAAKKTWPVNRDINWMPTGKVSLKDFVDEKKPATNHEKNLVVGYYLKEHLGQLTFNVSDVLGAFKAMGWKVPSDPANTLQAAASVTSWFDTRDMAKVRVTHLGDNAVEHELPRPAKK